MPTWRNELPPEGKHMGFDLRRTPQQGAIHAIITCNDLLVCDTHFYHGRTTPCERPCSDSSGNSIGNDCPACSEGIPYRTHVYLSAFDPKKNEHFIFECTSHAAKILDDYRKATGTLRGCIIYATRPKGLKNSKVSIETNTANLSKQKLPSPPDLIKTLCVIWRIPTTAVDTEFHDKKSPRAKVNGKKIREMDTQPNNVPDPLSLGQILNDRSLSVSPK
jgi:hypothetical protein